MPKQRTYKKLTEPLRQKIKEGSIKKSQLAGEARTYANRVAGAKKARKIKKQKTAKVDALVIPRDSEMYKIIEAAAKYKKMTVAQFIKKHRDSIEALMRDGDFVLQRETEYLIDDVKAVKKGSKVFVNDGNGFRVFSKKNDILHIVQFTQHISTHTEIFLIIYRVHRKLNGDLSHYLPDPEEYVGLEEEEELMEMLDSFYPEITYLISKKKDAKKKTVINPGAKERKEKKKAGSKGKPVNRKKR